MSKKRGRKSAPAKPSCVRDVPVTQTPAFKRELAQFAIAGIANNSITAMDWGRVVSGNLDFGAVHEALVAEVTKFAAGDLRTAEWTLMAQVIALNTMFAHLSREALGTKYFDQFDRYTRLALKAQNQCRATVETLVMIRNPPVFARQANIANGPQQINNGVINNAARPGTLPESAPNKLLESHGERLDTDPQIEAASGHSALEPMEALDGSDVPRGQSSRVAKRLPRRTQRAVSRLRQKRG